MATQTEIASHSSWRFGRVATNCIIDLDLIDRNTSTPGYDPAVAVVFPSSGSAWTSGEAQAHAVLKAVDFPVLPVVIDAAGAGGLPEALKEYNAFQTTTWGTAWANGLVDEVLSHAWQRRHERRVFISYKRSESARAAIQLHQLLTRLGYVTFRRRLHRQGCALSA